MNSRVKMTYSKGKAKNKKYTLRRLIDYIAKYKFLFIMALILSIISNVFSLISPYITGKIMGSIKLGKDSVDMDIVIKYSIVMFLFYLASSVLALITSIIMIKISKKIVYQMRKDAFDKIMKLPIAYFDSNKTGDVISRMTYDIDTVNVSLSNDLIQILTSVITVIGSLIMMIYISYMLVLVFVIMVPVSLWFTNFMVKKTRKYFKGKSVSLGELSGYMEEMITGGKTIKTYGKEQEIIDSFNKINENAAHQGYLAEYYSAYTGPGVMLVNNLSLSLIVLFGAILNKKMILGIEEISSFVLYSKKFSGPINEIANIFTDIQSAFAAAERVFELIDEKEEVPDLTNSIELMDSNGNVEFNHVSFGYNSDRLIIDDISFKVSSGSTIAIVGPTGSGKTTIVNLLMRFYDINSGKILLDDNSISDLTRKSLRSNFALVLQETWLFEGTVYENLSYGNHDVTLEDVKKAAKMARIDKFIESLPNGYDTILVEGGTNISKGEKQLLTIARAMLINSKMLILDEATSNVDTRTEKKIQEALKELMKNKTCFIIAHRLSTIMHADKIIVIKDGKLIEEGNHEELLKKDGFYSKLFLSQFK